jgi:hypothetical protein
MDKDELVHQLGAMLLDDAGVQSRRPWKHLVLVAQIMPGTTKVNGFAYRNDGEAIPTSPRNFAVMKKFRELRQAMEEPGKESWKAALVRIEDSTKHISIDFEYDHPEKWLIDPGTVDKMAETLRPAS